MVGSALDVVVVLGAARGLEAQASSADVGFKRVDSCSGSARVGSGTVGTSRGLVTPSQGIALIAAAMGSNGGAAAATGEEACSETGTAVKAPGLRDRVARSGCGVGAHGGGEEGVGSLGSCPGADSTRGAAGSATSKAAKPQLGRHSSACGCGPSGRQSPWVGWNTLAEVPRWETSPAPSVVGGSK